MAKIVDPKPAGATNAKQLAAFEKYIRHRLPPHYRAFLLRYNGGNPEPDAFIVRTNRDQTEHIMMCFFPMRALGLGAVRVDTMEELRKWPVHCAWNDLQKDLRRLYKKKLNPPLLPIGTDGLGNYVSIVLTGKECGAVVFLDHKTARPWALAPDLPAFLKSLRRRQRADHWDQSVHDGPPQLIAINHDEYHAKHIRRTSDGRQFFLTISFEPETDRSAGEEFVALFLFDAQGKLLEAKIDRFGPRATMDDAKRRATYEKRLRELGKVAFQRIEVAPFSVRRFGTEFGLIPRPPEEKDDPWAVELQPGNSMAFFAPWDSGDYDT